MTLEGGFAVVYDDGQPVSQYQLPSAASGFAMKPWMDEQVAVRAEPAQSLPAFLLSASERSDQPVITIGNNEFILGAATTTGGRVVVVGLPMPAGLNATVNEIRSGARARASAIASAHPVRTVRSSISSTRGRRSPPSADEDFDPASAARI